MSDHIVIERHGAVQTIRMNRPDKKNALTRAMYTAMTEALVEGDANPDIRAHVFKETEKQGCSFEAIVDGILENYVDMMKSVRDKGYTVSCFGPIASQSDEVPADEEVFTRFGTEEDRNRATAYFTHRLEERLKIESIPFLSVFEQMVSEDGYTKYQYLCPDLCHLGQAALPLVKEELRQKGIL